ncbi:hypothetical protein K438DRAFT_1888855 [Mycena galopus ATCC 62051]|nr:hypothetical protein K438DRAFT_1888855 [Mycena galopus ATCC 62051]
MPPPSATCPRSVCYQQRDEDTLPLVKFFVTNAISTVPPAQARSPTPPSRARAEESEPARVAPAHGLDQRERAEAKGREAVQNK